MPVQKVTKNSTVGFGELERVPDFGTTPKTSYTYELDSLKRGGIAS
jgi:hypothetical protein